MSERAAHAMPSTTLENSIILGMMTSGVSIIKTGAPTQAMPLHASREVPRSLHAYGNETYVNRRLTPGGDSGAGCQRKPTGRFRRRS